MRGHRLAQRAGRSRWEPQGRVLGSLEEPWRPRATPTFCLLRFLLGRRSQRSSQARDPETARAPSREVPLGPRPGSPESRVLRRGSHLPRHPCPSSRKRHLAAFGDCTERGPQCWGSVARTRGAPPPSGRMQMEEGFAPRVGLERCGAAVRGDPRREPRASPHVKASLVAIVKSFSPVLTSVPLLALLTPPLRSISLEKHHLFPIVLTLERGSLSNTASHPARGCNYWRCGSGRLGGSSPPPASPPPAPRTSDLTAKRMTKRITGAKLTEHVRR